ncbi:MAG: universal stress protein [Acidimicrobiaceae bacterium]|nr:universal stress protein [Acidimicrobiaceae bacterium]
MTNDTAPTIECTVVVGIDRSHSSKAALDWAAQQARLTDSPLAAIATWEWPTSYGAMIPWPDNVDFEADVRIVLQQSVDQVLGADHRAEVTQRVVHGHPTPALEDALRDAALLVVGSRRHGGFAAMLLGSVSEFLATHAHCLVVMVRGDEKPAD